jgi:hypothetical protein
MLQPDRSAHLDRAIAGIALEREARRFALTVQLVRQGESTPAMLVAARRRLQGAALAYTAAAIPTPDTAAA